jgi:hypothetical protein
MLSRRSGAVEEPRTHIPMVETTKGRKKFSFKEPEIMGFFGFKRVPLMRGARRSKSLQPSSRRSNDAYENGVRPGELEELEVRRDPLAPPPPPPPPPPSPPSTPRPE